MLGVATPTRQDDGVVAWIFYNRIDAHRELFHMETSVLLGHVMAHEMGHLLLPYGPHTHIGIMKGSWDRTQAALAAAGDLTFSREETRKIRARLSGERETTAAR